VDTANAAYAAEGDPAQTERGRPRPPADVLDAERAEYALAAAQQTAADELVILYKALGGGWEQNQSLPPICRPQPAIEAAFRRAAEQ
jgi:hypothetical protein